MIALLIPSHFEARDLLPRIADRKDVRAVGAHYVTGRLSGVPVGLAIIGMGAPHAARRAEAVLSHLKPRGVILAGFAGALDPALRRGEVCLAAGGEWLQPPPARVASVANAVEVVATAQDKARLRTASGCALVDMESADIAHVCLKAGVRLIVLRAVSDLADEDLPQDLLSRSYNVQAGKYTPLKLAAHLTRHPFKIRKLTTFLKPLPSVRKELTDRLCAILKERGNALFP